MLIVLAVVVVFIAALGSFKYMQIRKAIEQGSSWTPPPEAVTTTIAKEEQWPDTLTAVGSVVPVKGVTVSADLPGIVDKIYFESGGTVREGVILVQLDTTQERAQLSAAQAQLDLGRLNWARMKGLRDQGIVSQADYDRSVAEDSQAESGVKELRAVIERKTIRAPFAGRLGIRQVNLGQYLASGAPIVPLQSHAPIYVHFTVPQSQMPAIRIGGEVTVHGDGLPGAEPTGKITAVDSVFDERTRNAQVQATFGNEDGRMRPGMYVEARVVLGENKNAVTLPATAVSYAPYGDSVFIVEDMKDQKGKTYRGVRQQFVKLGPARGDLVAVVTGVRAGEEVVTSGVFKLRNGASVVVNNEVKPPASATPKPENS
jgi:membrane fusion protein (multidrug efflux system)